MTRRLLPVAASDPGAVLRALRSALTADGPAVFPHARDALRSALTADGPAVFPHARDLGRPATPRHALTADGPAVFPHAGDALRSALTADGPAVFPHPLAADGLPETVEQRVALVVQTSGSSGVPKRVALTADALLASAAASASTLGGTGQWLLALPTHYIAGVNVLVRSIAAGIEPTVVRAGAFGPEEFVRAALALTGDLRFTSLVPAQLVTLLESDAATSALRSFDRVLIGGQSMPLDLRDRAETAGVRVTTTYGSSETAGGCVYDGGPFATTRVRVVDGAIELGGPMLAEGYLDEALTEQRFHTADGSRWFRTGDAGVLDAGRLRVTGRLDRVIISGGVKVSLDALERVIRSLPELADAVAVAVRDERWGEVPVVVSARGVPLDELRDLVGATLGREARPARLIVADVPRLPSGKPDLIAAETLAAR